MSQSESNCGQSQQPDSISVTDMQIPGVKVQVYRIKDPIHGDDTNKFDAAVLAAPVVTREHLLDADCIIIGAPGRQGGFAGEVRLFLDSLAAFQRPARQGNTSQLMVRTHGHCCRLTFTLATLRSSVVARVSKAILGSP